MTLQTADEALVVLEHLAHAPGPQTLGSLSRELGLTKARTYRILETLRKRGYVTQDPFSRRYAFGPACARLALAARASVNLAASCSEALRWLWRTTEETVYLAVYEGAHAVVVDKLDSPRPVLAASSLGRIIPLHAVSGGKVLLASRSDDEIERLLEGSHTVFTDQTLNGQQQLRNEIRRIRAQGYAINREGWRDGVSGVAALVRWGLEGAPVAAIAVCLPEIRFGESFQHLRRSVIKAAAMASEALAPYGTQPSSISHEGGIR
jgi:DNA-binding IclR family transcriptional regulator